MGGRGLVWVGGRGRGGLQNEHVDLQITARPSFFGEEEEEEEDRSDDIARQQQLQKSIT